jgi:hypothetical protein
MSISLASMWGRRNALGHRVVLGDEPAYQLVCDVADHAIFELVTQL